MTEVWGLQQQPSSLEEAKNQATVQFKNVLVGVTIALIKPHDYKQLGEERVYLAYASISLFITEGS